MSRFPLLPLAMVAASVFLTCRTATEISVVVTTDFPCAALRHVHVTVGTLGDALERKPFTSTHASCKDGYAGTLVVVPSGANNDEVGFKIVAGITSKDAEECSPSADSPPRYGAGCIVARRALRYLPHTALTLPVTLRSTCEAVTCGVTETCVNGACAPAHIPDSSSCVGGGGGCSETTLGPGRDGGVLHRGQRRRRQHLRRLRRVRSVERRSGPEAALSCGNTWRRGRDSNHLLVGGVVAKSAGCQAAAPSAEAPMPCDNPAMPGGGGPMVDQSEAVEDALAKALEGATTAGRWDVVAQLARELEARRAHRASNVVQLWRGTR